MVIWTTRFSRKKAVFSILGMGIVMIGLIILTGRLDSEQPTTTPILADNQQRVEYLKSLGWEVDEEPLETFQFLLPGNLEEPYLSYNNLQLRQGFDLSSYCGKQLERYTYAVTNYPERSSGIQANLYICEEVLVAGDICCPGSNGFQTTLGYPQEPK